MLDFSPLTNWLQESRQGNDDFVVTLVCRILNEAAKSNASDIHFQPSLEGMDLRFRQDGVLYHLGKLPKETMPQIAARLKVLADLLTYKTNVPQEGRVRRDRIAGVRKEIRISTIPTLYGERIAVRFFAEENCFHFPEQLGFSEDVHALLLRSIRKKNGAVLLTGPAGSGKTTTAYALLRQAVNRSETLRSILTLEDPIEHALDGVAQVEVNTQSELPIREMIKYLMRQDPEVLMIGEIRDRSTAESALQAALTGHLLISTFHAGSVVDAVSRLLELGIEPFVLRSSLACVLSQRLVRKLCSCSELILEPMTIEIDAQRFELTSYRLPKGCTDCNGTGYQGRTLIAEALPLENSELLHSLIVHQDVSSIQQFAARREMIPLAVRATELIRNGITSPQEIHRVFG